MGTAIDYSAQNTTEAKAMDLLVEWIHPSNLNPRKRFDEEALQELADSIREHGLLEPLVVREIVSPAHRYELIAGERRWRACQLAGSTTVPVRVLTQIDDATALRLALIENLQR
ncbi:MAG: ParB/RepB/Spo0J family partition protein [Chloroflexota bacterium]|nr:ParB/RepB/Spo0J family partition protein [Chloroflexota bacterium]